MKSNVAQPEPQVLTTYSTLIAQIERLGYGEFLSSFAPHLIGTSRWAEAKENASPQLQLALDVLLLGRRHNKQEILHLIPAVRDLIVEGILVEEEADVYMPSLGLVCLLGIWVFVQRPRRNPVIYIGHDTFALAARIRPAFVERGLDLCAGPGTQGLYMASHGATVIAVELNAVAAEIARVNTHLNGLESKMTVRVGNLYDALTDVDKPFDLITANPPLLPFPDEHFYPFVGHGGPDGLAVTWKILSGLPTWLSENGRCQIIGTGFSDGYIPCAIDKFRAVAETHSLNIQITVVGHALFERGSTSFEGLAYTAAFGASAERHERIRTDLERIASNAGATHLCYFSLFVQRGTGQVDVLDLSQDNRQTLWFAD